MCTEATNQRGFTLVELVLGLVVFAAISASFYAVLINVGVRSADPVIQTQAAYLARAYLDEALLRDPSGSAEACGGNRALWQHISTYGACVNNAPPSDALGNGIDDLGDYRVSVAVSSVSLAAGTTQQRVEVTVTHVSAPIDFALAGYRAVLP